MPHSQSGALEAAGYRSAPFCARRVERFIKENARQPIGLAELAGVAGVSARVLQMAFRCFRNTTPMAHLRTLRLDLDSEGLIFRPGPSPELTGRKPPNAAAPR
jgi:AraC-like DNA-binding protein